MSGTKYERIPAAAGTVSNIGAEKAPAPASSSIVWKLFKFLSFLLLACVLVTAALMGTLFYGGRHLIGVLGELVVPKITSDVPIEIPEPIHLSEDEATKVHQSIHAFKHAIHHGNAPPHDLVLSERELNGLICEKGDHWHHGHHGHHHNRHRGDMCGNVHVTLSDQKITAAISVPLEDKIPGGEGRYFVGHKITSIRRTDDRAFFVRSALLAGVENDKAFPFFDVSGTVRLQKDGVVDVEAKAAEVFGWVASDNFTDRFLGGMNLADGLFQCPHFKKHAKDVLTLIEDVDIGDGKIVITVRPRANKDGEDAMDVDADFGMRNLRAKENQ